MKTILLSIFILMLSGLATAGSPMKLEGSCAGKLSSGLDVSFFYYSNFDGCRKISKASLTFSSGGKGSHRGKRSFTETQDLYVLNGGYKLIFANSTGNTSGELTYPAETGEQLTVTLKCSVRDYEYTDC